MAGNYKRDYSQIQVPVLAFVGYLGLPQDGIRDNHVTDPAERTIIEAVFWLQPRYDQESHKKD